MSLLIRVSGKRLVIFRNVLQYWKELLLNDGVSGLDGEDGESIGTFPIISRCLPASAAAAVGMSCKQLA